MSPENKKTVIWAACAIGAVLLLWLFIRSRRAPTVVETVNSNTTPVGGGGILPPTSYNIPPITLPSDPGTTYGGLTFVSAPASAFSCGPNTYYTSPEALANSPQGKSALDAADRSVFDLIDWDV